MSAGAAVDGSGAGEGIVVVVSGPSGAGKTTVLRRALERQPRLRFSVSHTTRAPRTGELEGRDYFFVNRTRFDELVEKGAFLEWAEYQGNCYGTSRGAVEEPTRAGFDLLLEVEVQGAAQLRVQLPGAVQVFVLPPSLRVLEQRLRARRSDSPEAIHKRLEIAQRELLEVDRYHYVIVNEEIEKAAEKLLSIIEVSRLVPGRVMPAWLARAELE
jgi:guanylate kinase